MNPASASIRRPVTTVMIVLIAVFLGIVSLLGIPSDLLPEMTFPVIAVVTRYSGAGPHEVEALVTRPLEEAAGSVGGVLRIASDSSEGVSLVMAEFGWGTDMDMAALEMREAVDMVREYLPSGTSSPMVVKADPSMMPVMRLVLSGPYDLTELTATADHVASRLERIDGVASVSITGGADEYVLVEADPFRLNMHGLTVSTLAGALRYENLSLPGGHLDDAGEHLIVRTVGEFQSLDDIRAVQISTPLGTSVSLEDIASVSMTAGDMDARTRFNGEAAITLSLFTQSDANVVRAAGQVHRTLDALKAELATGTSLTVVEDQAEFVNEAISTVGQNVVFGGILAVGILYGFLGNLPSIVVIGLAIPVSVITTFAFMFFSGLTLNLISLGGLALGVGMLVDNAIVILENIFQHRQRGKGPAQAAVDGTGEVAMAVTAATLTTVAVFLPVVFMEGMASQLFRQLALTISFALGSSLMVSLTFIPMAAAVFLAAVSERENVVTRKSREIQTSVKARYIKTLEASLARRRVVLAILAGTIAVALILGLTLPREFIPDMDQRQITVDIRLPRGTSLERTDIAVRELEELIRTRDDVEFVYAAAGSHGGTLGFGGTSTDRGELHVRLIPHRWGLPSTLSVMDWIRHEAAGIPAVETSVSLASAFAGQDQLFGAPVTVSVRGDDLDVLGGLAEEIRSTVASVPGMVEVRTTMGEGSPELQLVVDRQRAASFGLTAGHIATMVGAAIDGEVATRYREGGREMDVRIVLDERVRSSVSDLRDLIILSPAGMPVTLSQVADLQLGTGPTRISREDQTRTVEIRADVQGRDLNAAVADARAAISDLVLPPGYEIQYGGETQEIADAFGTLQYALILGCVLVYMVMAAQFESFIQPLIIMVAVPLALSGVVLALHLWGHALSVPSIVGVIAMAGIVVNNGIVLLSYANMLRAEGLPGYRAVISAAESRLRPILMTSLSTIIALLPMAIGRGAGGELQGALAVAVLGGMVASTGLTLFVVPVLYAMVERVPLGSGGDG